MARGQTSVSICTKRTLRVSQFISLNGHFLKAIPLELFLDTVSIDIDTDGNADNVTIYVFT